MAVALWEMGRGLTHIQTFTRCMNMPNSIAQSLYASVNKSLQRGYTEVAQLNQQNSAKETRAMSVESTTEYIIKCLHVQTQNVNAALRSWSGLAEIVKENILLKVRR